MQIVRSIHGNDLAGFSLTNELVVVKGFVSGKDGAQIYQPSQSVVSHFDDFLGAGQAFSTTVIDGYLSRKGTTNAVDWTVTEGVNGAAVGTIGDTTASMAVSGVQLSRGLDWKANQGGVVFETRVKLSAITNIAVFIGFTDQVAALEMPIQSAAGAHTITTNATDAVGFLFDTSDTSTDQWLLTGVAADVDATVQASIGAGSVAVIPVAATYETLRIELSSAGAATFYRNGVLVGSKMAGAVTATVALTPVIAGFNRTTSGTPTITADYFHVAGNRV